MTKTISTSVGDLRSIGVGAAAEITYHIDKLPDASGAAGKAWLCNLAVGLAKLGVAKEDDACLVHWVIEAPRYHPIWHSYSLVLVHLRPMADGRKTIMYRADATHELWLYAMDPAVPRDELIATGIVDGHWLSPKNFAAQFVEISDATAVDRIKRTVQEILDGTLSPDVDYTRHWVHRFGRAMLKDAP